MKSPTARPGRGTLRAGLAGLALVGAAAAMLLSQAAPAAAAPTSAAAGVPTATLSTGLYKDYYVNQTATISVYLSSTLTGTPYFVRIYDQTTGKHVGADCVQGTSCSATISSSTVGTHTFIAHVDSGKGEPPPYPNVGLSNTDAVSWVAPQLTYGIDASTVSTGSAVTITAHTTTSVTGSGLFMRITDMTTDTPVSPDCGTGSVCTATVSNGDGTHFYQAALLRGYGGPAPYPYVQAGTQLPVTWTSLPYRVTLTQSAPGSATVATANVDVHPTPYFISIWDLTTHTLEGTPCGSGTTCPASPVTFGHPAVAFVSTYNPANAFPPPGIVASSAVMTPSAVIIH